MVLTYKCSSCGSGLVYDIGLKGLKCHSCGNTKTIEAAESEFTPPNEPDTGPYSCPSCGGPVEAGSHGASMNCEFCGNPVVLPPRLSGEFAPRYLIPFSFGRDEAIAKYRKWCRHGLITPSALLKEQNIGRLTGEYVPFWVYDLDTNTKMRANCTRTNIYRLGDNEYTETSHFAVDRDIDLSFNRLPADASIRMDDKLMDLLEPYNYTDTSDFHMPMLSGFFSERFNFDKNQLIDRIRARVGEYCSSFVRSEISGYTTVHVASCEVKLNKTDAAFALLPVYTLFYTFKGKNYLFAMNGQTGKISGSPPISRVKAALWFAGLTGAIYGLIRLVSYLIWKI